MAYDAALADLIRAAMPSRVGVTEKPMFGGLAFLVNGNLAVSASSRGGLLVRVDPARTESLVEEKGVTRFEMGGRAMDGWLHVSTSEADPEDRLGRWVEIGTTYARSLPAK